MNDIVGRLKNTYRAFADAEEIRAVMDEAAAEITQLHNAMGRALLSVTVSGLTGDGYKNACAQARDLLRVALARHPQA